MIQSFNDAYYRHTPVTQASQLDCHSGNAGSSGCCWTHSGSESIQFTMATVDKKMSKSKMKRCFGTDSAPGGTFIVAQSPEAHSSLATAELSSCPFVCSETGQVTVSFTFWRTNTAIPFGVCTSPTSQHVGVLPTCVRAPTAGYHGTVTVRLPVPICLYCSRASRAVTPLAITIVAFNFIEPFVIALDDIRIGATQLGSCVPPPPPAPKIPEECIKFACSFDNGTCSYSYYGGDSRFEIVRGIKQRLGNRDVGVPESKNGRFIGTELQPYEQTILVSEPLRTPTTAAIMEFDYYEATENMAVMVCLDDLNDCPFSSNPYVEKADRQWKTAQVRIEGASQLYLAASNLENIGAAGIDDIRILDIDGNDICA